MSNRSNNTIEALDDYELIRQALASGKSIKLPPKTKER